MVDVQGIINYANKAMLDMLGYETQSELLGKNGFEFAHPDDIHKAQMALEILMRSGKGFPYEYRAFRKDGTEIDVEANTATVMDPTGKITGLIIVAKDITERNKAEQERIKLEEQLRQSQKMESVGRLAGGISHDFNNLLMLIMGYSEMLIKMLHPDDPRFMRLTRIMQAAEKATDLTRQLLAFSRKQVFELVPLDLSKLVDDFMKMIQRTIRENIKLVIDTTGEDIIVLSDAGQLEQVIMNLAVNAQYAMPDGGLLKVSVYKENVEGMLDIEQTDTASGTYCVIEFTDTGCGMDSLTLQHLFEPFFTTKEAGKGTGLGLSTVYGIVKQHGGFIRVHSDLGKGTTFKIFIPKTNFEIEGNQTQSALVRPDMASDESIIIAEDNDMVRLLTSSMLEQLGYNDMFMTLHRNVLKISKKAILKQTTSYRCYNAGNERQRAI
jgi:PAS domain S-box-containing protein